MNALTYPLCFLLAFALSVGCNRAAPTGPGAPNDGTTEPLDFTSVARDGGSPNSGADAGAANAYATGNDAGQAAPESPSDAGGAEAPPTEPTCACPEGFQPSFSQETCRRITTVDATYEGAEYTVCEASPNWAYGKYGAKYPGGTNVRSEYWGDDNYEEDGRLNEVGIWACTNNGTAGQQPLREWIGFTHCLDLESKSDYLVGIAGDNRVRLKLNGEVIFEDVSAQTSAFNYWWIQLLDVDRGVNFIEMEGYNDHGVASFGAEISGPFPPGSLPTDQHMIDADYASNIVFSTGEMVGQSFTLGEDSGWTCPDGYSLNLCGVDPACTLVETAECLVPDGGLQQ